MKCVRRSLHVHDSLKFFLISYLIFWLKHSWKTGLFICVCTIGILENKNSLIHFEKIFREINWKVWVKEYSFSKISIFLVKTIFIVILRSLWFHVILSKTVNSEIYCHTVCQLKNIPWNRFTVWFIKYWNSCFHEIFAKESTLWKNEKFSLTHWKKFRQINYLVGNFFHKPLQISDFIIMLKKSLLSNGLIKAY